MAPEILFKQEFGPAVDMYAIGVIAHELIIGHQPVLAIDKNQAREVIS